MSASPHSSFSGRWKRQQRRKAVPVLSDRDVHDVQQQSTLHNISTEKNTTRSLQIRDEEFSKREQPVLLLLQCSMSKSSQVMCLRYLTWSARMSGLSHSIHLSKADNAMKAHWRNAHFRCAWTDVDACVIAMTAEPLLRTFPFASGSTTSIS